MYGEIAAIFVSFVPFVFKTCTRVCRSGLQTRSSAESYKKQLRFGILVLTTGKIYAAITTNSHRMTPELLQEYIKFCNIREKAKRTNIIDLSSCSWFYPTSLLPLANFLKNNKDLMEYVPPINNNVNNYISTIMKRNSRGVTYMPITYLPKDENLQEDAISELQALYECGKDYGGANFFILLIGELIGNIYEHSEFSNASMMAQIYERKSLVEITILDDGISIPGCFEKYGIAIPSDYDAILSAINGTISTKTEDEPRGFGLRSSVRSCVDGIDAQLLLVSRNGALYKNKYKEIVYNIEGANQLIGTLISIRAQYPVPQVNIYDHIDG